MDIGFGACSDVGRRRQNNEDAYVADPGLRLFVVADGMGGHVAGEVASQTVVAGLHEFIRDTTIDNDKTWPFGFDLSTSVAANRLRIGILVANACLSRRIDLDEALRGTGSTLAAILLEDNTVVISNVGDCRVYRIRDGAITQVTRDDSWVAEQVRAGLITEAEARVHPWRNRVTKAVSGDLSLAAEVLESEVRRGDRFVLCSDGVHGQVANDELLRIVVESATENDACLAVIDAANARGGPDNATAIIVSILDGPEPREDAADATSEGDTIRIARPATGQADAAIDSTTPERG
jgi:PPM family protein phosphatase